MVPCGVMVFRNPIRVGGLYKVEAILQSYVYMYSSVVLVRSLLFSYGLVTVCKVCLHNSYSFG